MLIFFIKKKKSKKMKRSCFEGKRVAVYQDEGVGTISLKHSLFLCEALGTQVCTLSAQDIKRGFLKSKIDLFLMPGGAASPYARKLGGMGNALLRSYVEDGGAYLGICAGAYYGCASTEFDKGGPQEVITSRDLAFFKGRALGPVIPPYDPWSEKTSRVISITTPYCKTKEDQAFGVFYNGGCTFEAPYGEAKILAMYQNEKVPAVLGLNYVKGRVVLSGVHFEYDPHRSFFNCVHLENLDRELKKHENDRINFIGHIFEFLIM